MLNREELKKRIGELADRIIHENDEATLLELMLEIDKLIEIYRANAEFEKPPPFWFGGGCSRLSTRRPNDLSTETSYDRRYRSDD